MNIRIVRTALIAIAIASFASTALAQSAPAIYDSTVVGEAPPGCDLFNTVIVGENIQCADSNDALQDVAVVGNDNTVDAGGSVLGTGNTSSSGYPEQASGVVQVGRNNVSEGIGNIQTGLANRTTGNENISTGNRNAVDGDLNLTHGQRNTVNGYGNVSIGSFNNSQGQDTVLIGRGNSATADGCVAIGSGAECDETDEFSVGNDYRKMRVTNVAAGSNFTDAVNVGQIAPFADAFGGGANFNNGIFTMPTYLFQSGATYNDVGSALYDLDGRLTNLEQSGGGGTGPQGPAGDSAYQVAVNNGFVGNEEEWLASLKGENGDPGAQGPAGESGPAGQDGADGRDGVGGGSDVVAGTNIEVNDNDDGTQTVLLSDYIELSGDGGVSIDGGPSMTAAGVDAGNRRVSNVANGRIERGSLDAVNGGQVWALQQQWDDRWMEINNRLDGVEGRVDAVGAQSAAMAMMASSSRMLPEGKVAVSAAWGQYGNKAAFAVGLNMRTSPRSSFSMGISIGTGGKAMAGIGYSRVIN